ncbi:hypothetical protein C8R47DRAFT_1294392, partial [Mycena vitilis]
RPSCPSPAPICYWHTCTVSCSLRSVCCVSLSIAVGVAIRVFPPSQLATSRVRARRGVSGFCTDAVSSIIPCVGPLSHSVRFASGVFYTALRFDRALFFALKFELVSRSVEGVVPSPLFDCYCSAFCSVPVPPATIRYRYSTAMNLAPAATLTTLPVEVTSLILHEAVDSAQRSSDSMMEEDEYDGLRTFRQGTKVREAVRSTNTYLRNMVNGDPSFWTKLYICCTTVPEFVALQVSHIGTFPLDVHVYLHVTVGDNDFVHISGLHPDDPVNPPGPIDLVSYRVHDCLLAAVPSVHLWRNLQFVSTSDFLLRHWLTIFANVPAPLMESLFFSCPAYQDNSRTCAEMFISPVFLFRSILPLLTDLRLVESALPWGVSAYFSTLTSLELRDLPFSSWPTVPALQCALEASPVLARLELGGGGVFVDAGFRIRAFTMPALNELIIYYSDLADGFMDVLSAGAFPLLHTLSAHDFSYSAWTKLNKTMIYRSLRSLRIIGWLLAIALFILLNSSLTGDVDNPAQIGMLLPRLQNLTRLDISDTDSSVYVLGLIGILGPVSSNCPSLASLTVGEVSLRLLLDYVELVSSGPNPKLLCLNYYHGLRNISDEDRSMCRKISANVELLYTYPFIDY